MIRLIQIDGFGENRVYPDKHLSILQLSKAIIAEPDFR